MHTPTGSPAVWVCAFKIFTSSVVVFPPNPIGPIPLALISSLIENSLESTKDSIDIFTKIASKFEKTSRVEKEVQLINSFIPKINAAHPDWKLKLLDIDNLVSKKEEKQSNEDEY